MASINLVGEELHVRDDIRKDRQYLVPEKFDKYYFPEITANIIKDIFLDKKIILTGHTGTGKTSLYKEIAARVNQTVIRANLNGQTTISDFVGFWMAKSGEMVWVDGVLPTAMKNGDWIILDEIDYAEPFILAILNSVLEPKGTLTLKEKGHEVVVAHKDFRILATGNTIGCMQMYRGLYQGTNIMNEAFMDRFRVYHVKYLEPGPEAQVISDMIPKMNTTITGTIVKVANMIREAFEKGEVSCTFSLRRAIDWAEMMVRDKHPIKAAENTIFSKVSPEDAHTIRGIIQRVTEVRDK